MLTTRTPRSFLREIGSSLSLSLSLTHALPCHDPGGGGTVQERSACYPYDADKIENTRAGRRRRRNRTVFFSLSLSLSLSPSASRTI